MVAAVAAGVVAVQCPDCAALQHPCSTVCSECAHPLYPLNNDRDRRKTLDGSLPAAADRSE